MSTSIRRSQTQAVGGCNEGLSSSATGSDDPWNSYAGGWKTPAELALQWQMHGVRLYDPMIGRWRSVDPLASQMPYDTPYSYSGNDPVNDMRSRAAANGNLYQAEIVIDRFYTQVGREQNPQNDRLMSERYSIGFRPVAYGPCPPGQDCDGDGLPDVPCPPGVDCDPSWQELLQKNAADIGLLLTEVGMTIHTSSRIASRYNLPRTTIFLGPVHFRMKSSVVRFVSRASLHTVKLGTTVSLVSVGRNILTSKTVTVGDLYVLSVTGLALIPGAGLGISGTGLILEGVSYYKTGQGVSSNLNSWLDGGVIFDFRP